MRPLAIELAFDTASDQRLKRAWNDLSIRCSRGLSDSELGLRPHVTLALFRGREPRSLLSVAGALARHLMPFKLNLRSVDRFSGREGVVFLRPDVSDDLARAHDNVQQLLAEDRELVDSYYRPDAWQPHCTMAINIPEAQIGEALSLCQAAEIVGPVDVVRVQVVRYRPPTELFTAVLEGSRSNEALQPTRKARGGLPGR